LAKKKDVDRLYQMANQIPFDDQINHHANIKDIKLPLIKSFLQEIKSDLFRHGDKLPFETLCRQLQIVRGPDEYLKPVNIGLLMFNDKPEIFFPVCRIEIVEFKDSVGDRLSEKIFTGPIHTQLKDALSYIEKIYIKEEVQKIDKKAKAERFFNYPFVAIEEALANAVYHRDYQKREPIEVRIRPEAIEIQSFPGPMPPVTTEELNNKGRAKVREYRNRRIGDFLKELRLTEGRCTGIPKIQYAMLKNGSPMARFETDQDLSYFLTTLPIHPRLEPKLKSTQSTQLIQKKGKKLASLSGKQKKSTQFDPEKLPVKLRKKLATLGKKPERLAIQEIVLELCSIHQFSAQELARLLNKKSKKALVRDHLTPMRKIGLLEIVNPNESASNQRYHTST
jgi:ATP-dependent DNA helicase RecG